MKRVFLISLTIGLGFFLIACTKELGQECIEASLIIEEPLEPNIQIKCNFATIVFPRYPFSSTYVSSIKSFSDYVNYMKKTVNEPYIEIGDMYTSKVFCKELLENCICTDMVVEGTGGSSVLYEIKFYVRVPSDSLTYPDNPSDKWWM